MSDDPDARARAGDVPFVAGVPRGVSRDAPDAGGPDLRPDLQWIADRIAPGSHVLDLACGDGSLLAYLIRSKQCHGYGVEIDDEAVLACVRRGVDVVQQNIEKGLEMFRGERFDVVVLSMAIQATKNTEKVLRDMSGVASEGIVSFPNFGHWFHIWSMLLGRMPVTREMPYQWYDTPNLHLTTIHDFEVFLSRLGMNVLERAMMNEGTLVTGLGAGKRATQALYRFEQRARDL